MVEEKLEFSSRSLWKVFFLLILYIVGGGVIGGGIGYFLYLLLIKISLLSSYWWSAYFIPLFFLSGLAGGVIIGATEIIKYLAIETGIVPAIVSTISGFMFQGIDKVGDSEKLTSSVFSAIDSQIKKLQIKAETIRKGRGFFITRFLRYKTYTIISKALLALLESPEIKQEEFTSRERAIRIIKKGIIFYMEEAIDEILNTPFIIWVIANLILIIIPVIIGLIF